jgi:VanZ family protein
MLIKLRYFFPALIWLLIITVLSTLPGSAMPKFTLVSADKFGHAFVYGVLLLLVCWGIYQRAGKSILPVRTTAIVAIVACLYGVLMEFVQYAFCVGRSYDYDDMLANGFGAILGWGLWHFLQTRLKPGD